ncbi:MAG: hypothetical protein HF978_01655 [Desulfobacteraceae bacterium]|nr:hypothetical protein [Desulfobacteraceae bacterium]MBC2754228.1 hypothetical protein [Desulfobacteraceae bacterium]
MKERCFYFISFFILISFLLITTSYAQTTCEAKDCKITITIKIAFAGATDAQMNDWKQDIEDVWNGDGPTTGDCDCPVTFKVETTKITDPAKINCRPPPAGYHCIMVTPFATNPPKDTRGNTYVGYMYPPGISRHGQSLCGWWSDIMNRPAPAGGIYHDAAHEAGHMMGLDDKEGDGLMTHTSGDKAKPTQENIDAVVKNICGANACPDRCCCGNGVIDAAQGETCDPMALPSGCSQNEACCPICCNCFQPNCNPENGAYATQLECESACSGFSSGCYYNYKTGCWDCVKLKIAEHKPVYNESRIKHCNHPGESIYALLQRLIGYDFSGIPFVCPEFGSEWINLYITDSGEFSIITLDCIVLEVNESLIEPPDFPTMNAFTDKETVKAIANEEISINQALDEGRIIFEKLSEEL